MHQSLLPTFWLSSLSSNSDCKRTETNLNAECIATMQDTLLGSTLCFICAGKSIFRWQLGTGKVQWVNMAGPCKKERTNLQMDLLKQLPTLNEVVGYLECVHMKLL